MRQGLSFHRLLDNVMQAVANARDTEYCNDAEGECKRNERPD
jgi:hypothetical protein